MDDLLQENGDHLLLETGDLILLDSLVVGPDYVIDTGNSLTRGVKIIG